MVTGIGGIRNCYKCNIVLTTNLAFKKRIWVVQSGLLQVLQHNYVLWRLNSKLDADSCE